MKTLIFFVLILAMAKVFAGTAFFAYEDNTGGMTKQCVYDYLGSTYTITISSVASCPLSIPVK
jgi:hypothetical protein